MARFVGRMSMDPLVESVSFCGRLGRAEGSGLSREVVEVRERLDQSSAAAFLALPDAPARADLLERLGVLAQQLRPRRAGAPWAQEHRAFHLLLAEPLSSGLHSELTGAFHDIAAAMAAMASPSQPATSRAALTHVAIVEAAAAGDPRPCAPLVAAHYAPLLDQPARHGA